MGIYLGYKFSHEYYVTICGVFPRVRREDFLIVSMIRTAQIIIECTYHDDDNLTAKHSFLKAEWKTEYYKSLGFISHLKL